MFAPKPTHGERYDCTQYIYKYALNGMCNNMWLQVEAYIEYV